MPNSVDITMADLPAAMAAQAKAVILLGDFLAIDVTREVQSEIVEGTPVDTGLARSNWLVSSGSARIDIIEPYNPYPKFSGPKLGESPNAIAAKAQCEEALLGYNSGDPIYIVNNLDYIEPLEDGTASPQNAMFVKSGMDFGIEQGIAKASAAVAAIL